MRPWLNGKTCFALALLAVLGFPRKGAAQARYLMNRYVEPQWFTFHLSEVSAGVYAEGNYDTSTFPNSPATTTHQHLFVGPSLGFNASGSIYHPNFLIYQTSVEGAYGYSTDTVESVIKTTRNQWELLGRFSGELQFLPSKPVHGGLFANYDHTYRDNDFFNRVTVDSLRYGARTGGEMGAFGFNLDYIHRDETSSSPYPSGTAISVVPVPGSNGFVLTTNTVYTDQNMRTVEDTVTATARNERAHGGSSLTYNFNRYELSGLGPLSDGTDHSIAVGDGERFGAKDQYRLSANVSYSRRDSSAEKSDQVIAGASFNAEHSKTLSSYYDLNYDRFSLADFLSENYSGSANLVHQLYESLTSALTLRASDGETSADGSKGHDRRFGGGISENYVKRLSEEHRLSAGVSAFVDHADQEALGFVRNERHSFLPGGEAGAPPNSFFLNQPGVIASTVVVSDPASTFVFLQGFDYRLYQLGSRTVIERLAGSAMPGTVRVDYQTQPRPPGNYETFTTGFQVRLDLWKHLWGIYGRVNVSQNNAPKELRVLDYNIYTAGTDLNWRWLRAGVEYEIYDSTDSDYRTARLFQTLSFHTDEYSTLSLDLTEAWIDYVTAHRTEQDYRGITRYHRTLSEKLGMDVEAGVAYRIGAGVDELLAVFRPSVRYAVGKTTLSAGYDLEYNLFLQREERLKNLFYLRLTRRF